jgi:tetratricopeptide (TPR) repeat protein
VAAVGAAAGVFALREVSIDDRARRAHEHALQLALGDDVQSLEQARAELDQALLASPRLHAAAADRALVDLLLAGALAELPGDRGDQRARRERVKALVTGAGDALEQLHEASLARAEVARARAVAASFGASRTDLRKLVTAAEGELPGEPWIAAVEAAVDVRSTDHGVRDRALADITALVARRPDVLRARYVLARGQALAGRRNEALATLDGLLKANPRHEGALALRESIVKPPPGASVAAPGPAEAPPVEAARGEKPAPAPRKPDSTGGEVASTPRQPRPPAAAPQPRVEERPAGATQSPAEPPAAAGGESSPPSEPPPAPRLRPAAVPEPEPVRGGG